MQCWTFSFSEVSIKYHFVLVFFHKKISVYLHNHNHERNLISLTNIISLQQLGPGLKLSLAQKTLTGLHWCCGTSESLPFQLVYRDIFLRHGSYAKQWIGKPYCITLGTANWEVIFFLAYKIWISQILTWVRNPRLISLSINISLNRADG